METALQDSLRRLPAVNKIIAAEGLAPVIDRHGREAVVWAARRALDEARDSLRGGGQAPSFDQLVARTNAVLEDRPYLYDEVFNATGVLLHTNLGRAPLPPAAYEAMARAGGYCDLELDLGSGKRASRLRGVEEPLVAVTGAEAGMIVNNNAGAVLLTVAALAGTRPTAISRGHLVEIGGGFRLPTIMEALTRGDKAARPLLEIGTTNRTHLADYAEALADGAGLVLVVHRSNFVITGYVSEPEPEEIVALAHEHGVPVALDLGSGTLMDTTRFGLPAELTVPQAVRQGFDLICFSGDKLFGGPQAGFLVGKREAIERLRKHPLARALRCDKLQLAGCVATLELYRRGEAERQIPIWRMLQNETHERACAWREAVTEAATRADIEAEVTEAAGAVGGGSLPEGTVPGSALALTAPDPEGLLVALRRQEPPVIGHIYKDQVLLHPRTIEPQDDDRLLACVIAALGAVRALP